LSKGLEWAVVVNGVYFVSRLQESWKLDYRTGLDLEHQGLHCVWVDNLSYLHDVFQSLLHTLAYSNNSRFRYDFALVARLQYFSTLVLTARPVKFSCVLSCDATRVGPCQLWPFAENAAVLLLCVCFFILQMNKYRVSRLCCHFCWCKNYTNAGNCYR